jgi:hypothetical protein
MTGQLGRYSQEQFSLWLHDNYGTIASIAVTGTAVIGTGERDILGRESHNVTSLTEIHDRTGE